KQKEERMASVIIPPMPPSARDDALHLYRAFKGFGCDTAAVINILGHRNATQRAAIQKEYHATYSEDLNKRLSSELSGQLKRAVIMWMPDPATRDANIVRHALEGDVDLKAATEVICSRTPSQMRQFKQIYFSSFDVDLEDDLATKLSSGDHKKLLVAYISVPRYEGPEYDQAMVQKDAELLNKAGEKKLGTDEKVFIQIFSERSRAHLVAVGSAYQSSNQGNIWVFFNALLTILQCADHPGKYFARVLRKAMKGLGTDDPTLIRVIVTRAEIDMQYIKAEYRNQYGKSLHDAVQSDTSGHYKAFLLSLSGTNP
ncbi:annexin 5, partial [Prunus dulcis]